MKTTQRNSNPYKYTDTNKRYYTYDYHLRKTFGGKCAKIPLDGGFTCPNIDGRCSVGGCIYCSGRGSGDFAELPTLSVREQYERVRERLSSKWSTERCIPYFQAHSNTYGDVDRLRRLYYEALALEGAVALNIATRADCLGEGVPSSLRRSQSRPSLLLSLGFKARTIKRRRLLTGGIPFPISAAALSVCDRLLLK